MNEQRLLWWVNRIIVLLVLLAVASFIVMLLTVMQPAQARWGGPCPKGSILRVHLGKCVSVRSSLAHSYVRLSPAPPHHRLSHGRCDPVTQCGDPIEDRVVDPPPPRDPPQTGGMTPRDDWTPPVPPLPPLPDAFRRGLARPSPWRL